MPLAPSWKDHSMPRISELALPDLPIDDADFGIDPFSRFSAARNHHPWLAKCAHGYVVTEYGAIRDLLLMDDRMRGPYEFVFDLMNARGSRWARFQEESLLALWGEPHKRIRDVLAPMFTPRAANERRGLMRDVIRKLLDEWAPKGHFDFEEFAAYFPITVMCSLIGASPGIIPEMRSSLETLGLSLNLIPDFLPKLEQAVTFMESFLERLVKERRAGKRPSEDRDLLDALIAARDAGGLTDQQMTSFLIFLFVAGYDTSKNVLTMMMDKLIDRPDIYTHCAQDVDYCHKVVEESLRYRNPGNSARLVNEEFTYRDIIFPKDTMLFLPNSISGRDPSAVSDPDIFDPDRPQQNRHLAFGRGMHMCLGQYIARAQIEESFHLIAQRLKDPKRTGKSGTRPFPGTWGLKGLPIAFTPAGWPEGSGSGGATAA
jgi:cytochrome P450